MSINFQKEFEIHKIAQLLRVSAPVFVSVLLCRLQDRPVQELGSQEHHRERGASC